MFCHFPCQDAILPACFVLQFASACLILACFSTFSCRPATCFGMFYFGMFKFRHGGRRSFRHVYFGMLLSACLISACFNTFFQHTHMLPARCWFCLWSKGSAQLRCSNAVTQQCYGCCFLHANFHPVVLVVVVLFWSLRPN